jgi:copper chaperone NosL
VLAPNGSGWKGIIVALVVALSLAACAPGQAEIAPPEIAYGETQCADCSMIISDVRFASGYAREIAPGRYESTPFDDIGDMLAHAAGHPDDAIVAWYVHDYQDESWLDATQAIYVMSKQIASPMGHGIAAFGDADAAAQTAAELDGQLLSWDELRAAETNLAHNHN